MLTEMKTEISVNGKIWILLTKTKMETETKKIRKNGNETEMGNLKRKLINLAISVSFPLYFRSRIALM